MHRPAKPQKPRTRPATSILLAAVALLAARPAGAATPAIPAAVVKAVKTCPALARARAPVFTQHPVGAATLYIILCDQAGDDEYFAVVSQAAGRVRRQSLPGFEKGRLVADIVDRDAHRKQELGQLAWDAGQMRLVGELSGGCGFRTEYSYRWAQDHFVLAEQRTKRGCDSTQWTIDYRGPAP
ncbi:MAG: hypothetical protein JWM33_1072 [Caulobacteraceae bacterium]|nr:hypothetical protein [Caulobacteraceae bacterium]